MTSANKDTATFISEKPAIDRHFLDSSTHYVFLLFQIFANKIGEKNVAFSSLSDWKRKHFYRNFPPSGAYTSLCLHLVLLTPAYSTENTGVSLESF